MDQKPVPVDQPTDQKIDSAPPALGSETPAVPAPASLEEAPVPPTLVPPPHSQQEKNQPPSELSAVPAGEEKKEPFKNDASPGQAPANLPTASSSPEPVANGRPWGAKPVVTEIKEDQTLSDSEPKLDYGTPWQPSKKFEQSEMPQMEMPKQKIAAVNFNKPVAVQESEADQSPKRKGRWIKKLVRAMLILLPLGLIAAVGVMAYQVTYERATYGFPEIEQKIASFILELPFTPKTPEYILGKMLLEMEKVHGAEFDFSLAMTSSEFTEVFGMDTIQFSMVGDLETLDDGSARGNIRYDITREFQVDIRLTKERLYFKVNTLFPTLLEMMGEEEVAQLYQRYFERRWFYVDISDLETEAEQFLREYTEERAKEENLFLKLDDELKDRLFATMTLEEGDLNGSPMQVLSIQPDEKLIEDLFKWVIEEGTPEGTVAPDYYTDLGRTMNTRFSDMKIDLYIDETYRLSRLSMGMELTFEETGNTRMPLTLPSSSKLRLSAVLDLESFNKRVEVEEPIEAQSIFAFIEELTGVDYSQDLDQSIAPILGDFDFNALQES